MADPTTPAPDAANVTPTLASPDPSASVISEPDKAASDPIVEGSEPTMPEPKEGEEVKPKRSASGRIAELFAQKKAAEAQAAVAASERDRYRKQLEEIATRRADPNISLDQLDSLRVTEAVKAERADQLATEAQNAQRQVAQRRHEAFQERVNEVRDRLPDFDQVVHANVPISNAAADLIAESEYGPQIAYHLGKNIDLAERIAAMPPHLQGREIARIEQQVSVPLRKVSNAPNPPPRVGGNTAPAAKDPNSMSMSEFAQWYGKQAAAARS